MPRIWGVRALWLFLLPYSIVVGFLPSTSSRLGVVTGLSALPPPPAASSSSSTESVHLRLQEVLRGLDAESDDDSKSIDAEKLGFGVLTAIVDGTRNETILAAQGSMTNVTVSRLRHFALHRLGVNFSSDGAHALRVEQRVFDLRLNSSLIELHDLFRSEKLLVQDKEFPPKEPFVDAGTGEADESKARQFEGKLFSSAQRLLAMRERDMGWRVGETGPTEPPETRVVREWLEAQPGSTTWRHRPDASAADTLAALKTFLLYFRENFPYYYSNCLYSDCSFTQEKSQNMYLGCVYPRPDELQDRAGVTELNLCASCQRVTRFPRFNALGAMMRTRRGRCGEYSVLCMKMLELLGYTSRWVVDWADHVWCEVSLYQDGQGEGGNMRWVHVDPCEASIDENLLYEGWGKNATFIFAIGKDGPVDDRTMVYTSVAPEEVDRRREREGVNSTIVGAAVGRANLLWSGA